MKSHDEQRKLLDERLTHKTRVEPQVEPMTAEELRKQVCGPDGLPEEVCEAYGWLFHETSSERANKARRLLLTCMTKAQQKVGIQMAKERGAVVRRMSTTRGE